MRGWSNRSDGVMLAVVTGRLSQAVCWFYVYLLEIHCLMFIPRVLSH